MFSTPKPLTLIEKIDINKQLLAIRYKDSIPFLQEEKSQDAYLAAHIKRMLLGYGGTHAGHFSGLFMDRYLRDGSLAVFLHRKSNLVLTVQALLSNKDPDNLHIPIHDINIVSQIFTNAVFNIRYIEDVEFLIIPVPTKSIEIWKDGLGYMGQLLSKNMQLWLAANMIKFKAGFELLLIELDPRLRGKFDSFITDITYQPSLRQAEEIQADIIQKLTSKEDKAGIHSQVFFLNFLNKLIRHLNTNILKNKMKAAQVQLAFSRIEFILDKALDKIEHYETFILYIEYLFDEIVFLVSLTEKIKKDDILNILARFIDQQYMLTEEDKVVDTRVALGNSGMEVLTNLMYSAINEVRQDSAQLYLQTRTYYELRPVISWKLDPQTLTSMHDYEICYMSDNKKNVVKKFDDTQLVDIIVSSFNNNMTGRTTEYTANDIYDLVENQLQLRRDQHCEEKRLIAIIDTTLNAFDDSKVAYLLMLYAQQIQDGQFAVLIGHSLNKYFHIGFDKLPAGLSVGFYQKDKFPLIEKYFRDKPLDRYFQRDPTPRMINYILKNADEDIAKYYHMIKGNARYVHETIVPKELFHSDCKKMLSVCKPYSGDSFKEIWGFIVIRLEFKKEHEQIGSYIQEEFHSAITHMNIRGRDGYGFNRMTQCAITDSRGNLTQSIFRLNIGTESQDNLKHMLAPIMQLCLDVNTIIDLCLSRIDMDTTLDFIKELFVKFLNEEPKKNAAKKANPDAHYKIGYYYEGGESKKDLQEAFAWYQIAALQNHVKATYKVAKCYEKGIGTEKNISKANEFYQKAATLGHAHAQTQLSKNKSTLFCSAIPRRIKEHYEVCIPPKTVNLCKL